MMVITRFQVPEGTAADFRTRLEAARDALAARPGFVRATIGRNVDDPQLWSLVTAWESVGAYRRALSAYDVKMHAVPVLSEAVDEPSAYELVEDGAVLNIASTRSIG